MDMGSSDNHYTTAPQTLNSLARGFRGYYCSQRLIKLQTMTMYEDVLIYLNKNVAIYLNKMLATEVVKEFQTL